MRTPDSLLIAEDLLVLLLDDASGKPHADSTALPRALAGAVLLELAMADRIRVTEQGEDVRKGHVVTVGTAKRPADPVLARAFELLKNSRPMKPQRAIEKLGKGLREQVTERIIARGWVRAQHDKVLGLFPRTKLPARDGSHKAAMRAELESALLGKSDPTQRSAALISLLSATDVVHKVFPDEDKRAVKKRAKEIAEGEWAGAAVRKAISDINTAIMTAVIVSTSAGAASSGS
ncbi:GPP34 family phosphoprotein [Antrihabitans sp. YC3-6]|uniref:GPP34 family phosphoprotein n=1 Tax=Antrihabitans stalagmiti TaxID=2799499 RepID=A0A934NSS6_9NOCA|nr:GPP34 family phosphoprotein [Antrihabitans stalagmiti]MBJ8340643.1 GPP34 family phosphoprotein [Antrihabitans stalagmiti]